MGSALAVNAYMVAREKNLGNAATRLLVWMALSTADEAPRPTYFGGAFHRSEGLSPDITERAVRALMNELKSAGVIVQLSAAHRGRNADYELRLETTERRNSTFLQSPGKAEAQVPPVAEKGGRKHVTKAEAQVPPYPLIPKRARERRARVGLAVCGHKLIPGVDNHCEMGCQIEATA